MSNGGTLLGCSPIADLISCKKFSFLLSITALPITALPGKSSNAGSRSLILKLGSPCWKPRWMNWTYLVLLP